MYFLNQLAIINSNFAAILYMCSQHLRFTPALALDSVTSLQFIQCNGAVSDKLQSLTHSWLTMEKSIS